MLTKYNPNIEPQNWQDGVNFSYSDPCIFIIYRSGASGDLLASIINSHYINTGSDYFGINKNGQVMFRPSDYKIINRRHQTPGMELENIFDEQLLFDIADSLGNRNLNYSMMDQIIFSNHMYRDEEVKLILDKFPNCKIIRIVAEDSIQDQIIRYQDNAKNKNTINRIEFGNLIKYDTQKIKSTKLLNIPYISLFSKNSFNTIYEGIVKFLELNGQLIRFNFIEYYLKQQSNEFITAIKRYNELKRI